MFTMLGHYKRDFPEFVPARRRPASAPRKRPCRPRGTSQRRAPMHTGSTSIRHLPYVCVCVCVCVWSTSRADSHKSDEHKRSLTSIHTHTHTHTHKYTHKHTPGSTTDREGFLNLACSENSRTCPPRALIVIACPTQSTESGGMWCSNTSAERASEEGFMV
jgi:hypothetical protein